MKKSRILAGALLAGGLWSSSAFGQAPAAPAVPGAADPAAAAAKPGICEKIDKALDKKRRKLCQIPLGQMLNSITKPLSAATGGIIPSFCPAKPGEEELKKAGSEGAAANLMKDAVEAQARRRAVRIMGTFDCHWNPEAEMGLATALRTDRAECVRLEAAIALNRGCCCTRLIVEALEDCVGGTDKLGPSENSPRVQMIAQMALERCLTCPEATLIIEDVSAPPVTEPDKTKEQGEPAGTPRKADDPATTKPLNPAPNPPMNLSPNNGPSVKKGSGKPTREQLEHAKQTLAKFQAKHGRSYVASEEMVPPGQRSVAGLANYVVSGGSKQTVTQTSAPPVAAKTTVAEAPKILKPVPVTPTASTAPATLDPKILRCLETLRDAQDPEVRHNAVKTLAACNWREHPEAVSGLIYAARNDNHAGLRVACLRSLTSMKVNTPEVITGLKPMMSDSDEWIRQETAKALANLQSR